MAKIKGNHKKSSLSTNRDDTKYVEKEDSESPYVFRATAYFLSLALASATLVALLAGMTAAHMYPKISGISKVHSLKPIQVDQAKEVNFSDDAAEDDDDYEDIPFIPPAMGLELSVDIRGVDRSFLSSEDRLTDAMVRVAEKSSLTLFSYHCVRQLRRDPSRGISCIGVMSKGSHISFQTWPKDLSVPNDAVFSKGGVVILDILSSGPHQLDLQHVVLPAIENEFAIPIPGAVSPEDEEWQLFKKKPIIKWNLCQRNNRNLPDYPRNAYWEDFGSELTFQKQFLKTEVASVQTNFQRIDIYDVLDPRHTLLESYYQSLSGDGSYEALHPELFKPNRYVYLDGVVQSIGKGNAAYHEALVQPAMFAHDNPRRVAIIGGGEGSTLREILKHKSLEYVIMIDIDEKMVKESAKHLYPDWNACDDIFGSTSSCFDDPRAEIRYEDALEWFIDRFHEDSSDDEEDSENEVDDDFDEETEKFDVIIMDALDPQDTVEFAEHLYQNNVFLSSLYNALDDDGILIAQLGETSELNDPPESETIDKNRASVKETIVDVGFKSMHIFEESRCEFESPWLFLAACKSTKCRSNWYSNPAQIEKSIHQRILPSISGSPLLKYFDGATMASYQVPRKAIQWVHCIKYETPEECQLGTGYNPHFSVFSENDFEVQVNNMGELEVTAKVDIPKMSYIKTGEAVNIPSRSSQIISKTLSFGDTFNDLTALTNFIDNNGIDFSSMQKNGYLHLSFGIPALIKHDQNGTPNIGHLGSWMIHHFESASETDEEESDSSAFDSCPDSENVVDIGPGSPVVERHLPHFGSSFLFSLRDISKGEQILKSRAC